MTQIQNHAQNPITVAMSAPKIRDMVDTTERLKQIYRTALITCGHKNIVPEEVRIQVTILEKSLKSSYAGITIEEVSLASERGAIGEYGEFVGISPATFIFWVRGYLGSFERKEALRTQKNASKQLPKPKTLTIEEKLSAWNEAKAEFRKTGRLLGEIQYFKYGCEIGKIDLQDEEFKELVKYRAQEWFEHEVLKLKELKGLTAKPMILKIKEILSADDEQRSNITLWQNRCKRIAVELIMSK